MKIIDILSDKKPHISLEIFPPKTDAAIDSVLNVTKEMAKLSPSFVSVTYGAGGGTSKNTVRIVSHLQNDLHVTPLAHLTCVSSTPDEVKEVVKSLKENGIENILALRGDIPKDAQYPLPNHYRYASELISQIKDLGDFCIGAACYPEGHTECVHKADDIKNLKHKVECGVSFLTTQMFFDNAIFYNFLYRVRDVGITVPVLPGIMPVTNGSQIKRICELSGTVLPSRFRAIADHFGDTPKAMEQAGIAYATEQIIDLFANGINHIHIYTMNKPEVASAIFKNLSEIL
ncbi:MAG: methylenetetrahydrofolate reductase [NAD(P)H] [Lachnospiraceae bacterium]|jgi:methylenetetrahydrofolate reductase (NADPH)|nr:methylenetetrahydrofolate reductase [NAD(P)H] [Lachnospiraceae bacterium]